MKEMDNSRISQAVLVGVLLVLVSTVDADLVSYVQECLQSQESVNELTRCKDAFPGPSPISNPVAFPSDSNIFNYCRNYKAMYITCLECYNSVKINCYKPEHQDLARTNSGLRSAIEYFCQRDADGYTFDTTCEALRDNAELDECYFSQVDTTTPSGNITYEGFKYNLCRSRDIGLNCFRNNNKLKTTCPDTQTTDSTVLGKQIAPACDAGNGDDNGNSGNKLGIGSLIIMTILISFFDN